MSPHAHHAAAAGKAAALKHQLARAAHMGRGGDTMIAHINPQEAAMLKAAGGSGTVNPETGLREFRVGGSMGAGDPGQGSGHGGPSGAGGSGRSGSTGGNGMGGGDPHPAADRFNQPAKENPQLRDWAKATNEYDNRGWAHKIGDFLAGSWYNENKPNFADPRTFWGGTYHTSTNPVGAAAGLAGMAGGPIGALVGKAISMSGIGPEIYHTSMDPNSDTAHAVNSYNSSPGGIAAGANGPMSGAAPGPTNNTGSANPQMPQIQGPVSPHQIFSAPAPAPTAAVPPPIFQPPQVQQSMYNVPGGLPYGVSLFGRRAA